jgi:hypothetical protein
MCVRPCLVLPVEAPPVPALNGPVASDFDAIATLPPGQYDVAILSSDTNQFTLNISMASPSPSPTDRVPLFASVLAETPSSAAVSAQSKAELLAFLQTLMARGSFAAYAQPEASYSRRVPRVLTIAGSDSGGGAGIQADLKACTNLGVFSTSAITAVTVQNTRGVHAIHAIPVNGLADQITCVLDDIGADVVKVRTSRLASYGGFLSYAIWFNSLEGHARDAGVY